MVEVLRVTFESAGAPIVGNLFVPPGDGRRPAVVVDGPLTSVKEQAQGNHARALAERGFVTLAFDHRFFGESGGTPRQYESPPAKIEDLRHAVDFLAAHERVDPARIGALGVCAGAGYVAGFVAEDPRISAFAAVAGFFHDAAMQRKWMGDAAFEAAVAKARAAREHYEATGECAIIPAVGDGEVAMPLAEARAYYGTPRGAVPNYTNAFAVMSREHTLPYDAQSAAPKIRVPTLLVHSEKALA
ncbi:MAG TPA: alpha/beta fold hydrolase, partial [Nannocystis sp.]